MGTAKTPKPVKFFASIIFKDEEFLQPAEENLKASMGDIEEKTAFMPFYHTKYYKGEMGKDLSRFFILFEPLLQRDTLLEMKLKTNDIEHLLSTNGKRTVNIDPGYIALEHVVLATTKGYTHRIYLGKGIFADLTFIYNDGTYKPLEWTYPDYSSKDIISLFNKWRDHCKKTCKHSAISDQLSVKKDKKADG
jgi:hypothetical protein